MDLETARSFGRLAALDRNALVEALAARFPATAAELSAARALAVRGGRDAALGVLAAIDPVAYGHSRNHVGGAVTRLSPWIRHGVVSLAEVRDAALARVRRPEDAEKLVSELAWRDYWRQVHAALGASIETDIEGPAMLPRRAPLAELPADVLAARTGLACIDAFVTRLHTTGWLHNHERMWLASWLVHARGVRWQAGADWFLRHLLDGDPASNHLSWQWVAGTFSARPYLFNRENLERFTAGVHCTDCAVRGHCDVEGTYDDLAAQFFAGAAPARHPPPAALRGRGDRAIVPAGPAPARPLVWITLGTASAVGPAAAAFPAAPRLFILDPAWLAAERPSLKRLVFLFECLADIPDLLVVEGPPAEVLPAAAAALACDGVAVAWTPCHRDGATARTVAAALPVAVIDEPLFCDRSRVDDLRRFSRYWQKVRDSALRPTGTPPAAG
jgi:deoxyribodipyrimidine photo-lyase